MKSTEKATQKAVLDYLSAKKKFHWRQNQGAVKTEKYFYRFTSMNGMPDIFCIDQGKVYGIEIKDVKGYQSDTQKEFQKNFEKAGGIYVLCKQVEDVMEIL
jgi:hypothetical protein